jgi:hypothetical protein
MKRLVRTAVLAVGVAAVSAVAMPARTAELPPALQSFGVNRAVSAFELSATGAAGFSLQPVAAAELGSGVPSAEAMHLTQFAGSTVVSPTLALDAGRGLDIGARFTSYDRKVSPFLTRVNAPYLSLANGGRYAGMTYVPAPNLRMRLGTSINSERLDRFRFDPIAPTGPLAMTYDASQTRSILGGVSWDVTSAIGLDFTAISSDRSGVPLGFANASQLASRARTNAFSVSAYADMGKGWVTTASFSQGMTQLNQKGSRPLLREQSYSLAIAKHGLFDSTDTLGFAAWRAAFPA